MGGDGDLWFTAGQVGKITMAGAVTLFNPLVVTGLYPGATAQAIAGITKGPDGNVWFPSSSATATRISDRSPRRRYRELPALHRRLSGIWRDRIRAGRKPLAGGRVTSQPASGTTVFVSTVGKTFTTYTIPNNIANPFGIVAGPDGNMWVVENDGNKVAKVTPSGIVTEFTIPTPSVP